MFFKKRNRRAKDKQKGFVGTPEGPGALQTMPHRAAAVGFLQQ